MGDVFKGRWANSLKRGYPSDEENEDKQPVEEAGKEANAQMIAKLLNRNVSKLFQKQSLILVTNRKETSKNQMLAPKTFF